MTVHLSPKQARRLGLDVTTAPTRHRARGPYATRCVKCGETFPTMAAETRHMDATGHHRYELELTRC